MAQPEMPVFTHTPVEAIPAVHTELYNTFHSQQTKPLEYRLTQLRRLWWGIKDAESLILEACARDLGKPAFEAYMCEVGWILNDIIYVCKNLAKWMEVENGVDIAFVHWPMSPKVRKDPLGVVLVLGAYNFPVQLSVGPLIGAIAAGCTAVLKPSESSPATAAVLEQVINNVLDPSAYRVVNGGVPESTALLDLKWDKIFYTGGEVVGRIIAKKAAETLTPVTLELGGKNPAFVTRHADPRLAARRLLWAKHFNAGQVCISQNYILVHRDVLPALIDEFKAAIHAFYPDGVAASPDYARIVNERQFAKLKKMLDASAGKVLAGGSCDAATRFMEPTLVLVDSVEDSMLIDESFGPLIPILPFSTLEEAIAISNKIDPTPLGVYPFGNKQEIADILGKVRSGGASVNDGYYHGSIPNLEFGGVGSSGSGCYRGKASFDAFTHRRSITRTPGWAEKLLDIRYPPYKGKLAQWKMLTDIKPDFGRDGKVKPRSLVAYLLLLGARGIFGGVARWAVVVAAVALLRTQYARL